MADYPVNPKNFGGANVNWNEVKSAKITKNKNGQKTYTIVFKTGVTAQYPVQKGGASIQSRELTMWQSIDNDTKTVANGFKGLQLKGSEKDDYIIGRNLKNSTIDVANDKGNDDHVVLESLSQHQRHGQGRGFAGGKGKCVPEGVAGHSGKLHRACGIFFVRQSI